MDKKLIGCLTNPIKSKLLVVINNHERTTAKELADMVQGVPQTTLYRHLGKMVQDGFIKVVEERQIRNVREKVYAIAIDLHAELERIGNDPSATANMARLQLFLNGIIEEFKEYQLNNAKEDHEAVFAGSGTGYLLYPFYATRDEVGEIQKKIAKLIEPYLIDDTPNRQLRNMAIVFTPPSTNIDNNISRNENQDG